MLHRCTVEEPANLGFLSFSLNSLSDACSPPRGNPHHWRALENPGSPNGSTESLEADSNQPGCRPIGTIPTSSKSLYRNQGMVYKPFVIARLEISLFRRSASRDCRGTWC